VVSVFQRNGTPRFSKFVSAGGISVSDFLIEATAKALRKNVHAVNRDSLTLRNQETTQKRLTAVEESLILLTQRLTKMEQQVIYLVTRSWGTSTQHRGFHEECPKWLLKHSYQTIQFVQPVILP